MVTIALAAYNVEDYLEDCLKSILNQTYKNFELICIDDGSSDNTLQILEKYQMLDARIRIITNSINEGLAVARNLSIEEAKGDYIWLIDGDDVYDLDLLQIAMQVAQKENSDVVIWDYETFVHNNELNSKKNIPSRLVGKKADDRIGLLNTPAFTWVKLIKLDTAKKLKIYFPKGLTRQDIPVHWHLMTSSIKISIIPKKLSFYRQQPNATTAQKNEKLFHLAFVLDHAKKKLEENNNWAKYSSEFYKQQLNLLFGMYDNVRDDLKEKALALIKERLTIDHYKHIQKHDDIRKQAKWFYLSLEDSTVNQMKFFIWRKTRTLYRNFKR